MPLHHPLKKNKNKIKIRKKKENKIKLLMSKASHNSEPCSDIFKCMNCKGDHQVDSYSCSCWHNHFNRDWHVSQIRYSLVVILELSGVSEVQYKDVMMIDDGKYQ